MSCLVCGERRTVESHLVPRALYRDLAGNGQHGFEANRFSPGVTFQAKGSFDRNILCRQHEDWLNAADTYGVDFIRNFHQRGRLIVKGNIWEVPSPRPDLLLKFVAACIWRRGVSKVKRADADLELGPAEPRLQGLLFGSGGTYDPPFTVARRNIVSDGTPLRELMFEPAKGYGFGDNTWSFFAFGCEFTMKLNPYSSPAFPAVTVANGRDPIWAFNHDPQEITDIENVVDIAVNMFLDPRTGKPRPARMT